MSPIASYSCLLIRITRIFVMNQTLGLHLKAMKYRLNLHYGMIKSI